MIFKKWFYVHKCMLVLFRKLNLKTIVEKMYLIDHTYNKTNFVVNE